MVAETQFDILIHPLVLLNISDYYTRVSIRTGSADKEQIAGICLGTHVGRAVTLETAFEARLLSETSNDIDTAFLETRLDQYKQVFPALETIAWFTIGASPGVWESSVQAKLAAKFSNPLLVMLSPEALSTEHTSKTTELPFTVYECQIEVSDDTQGGGAVSRQTFVPQSWKLETGEAERIAVDHVSKVQVNANTDDEADRSEAALIAQYTTQSNAVKMLSSRISLLKTYVQDAKDGKVPENQAILRQIQAVLQRFPVTEPAQFSQESTQQLTDVLLTQQLSNIISGSRAFTNLVSTYTGAAPGPDRGWASSTVRP